MKKFHYSYTFTYYKHFIFLFQENSSSLNVERDNQNGWTPMD